VYTVYAIDSRNHGQSTMTNEFHYDTMALDIEQMIEKLKLSNVTLVGFSDGGILCLIMASKQPKLVKENYCLGCKSLSKWR
jgi:pimeloyl-ACP methyl ester carboxylesterase